MGCADSSEAFYRAGQNREFIIRCQDAAPAAVGAWFRAEIEFVAALIRSRARVLDVGCGSGRVVRDLASCGRVLVGVDINPTAVREAQCRLRGARSVHAHVLVGDGAALPFAAATFDAVTFLINTLGNFGERKAAFLREAWRVLRAGGVLIASVYSLAADRIQRRWYGELCRLGIMGPVDEERSSPHVLATRDGYVSERFDRPSLAAVFAAAGLRASVHEIRELLIAVAPR